MVGDAVLGEVVSSDLLRPLAGAHLGSAGRVQLRPLSALLDVQDARSQDRHRLGAVLELGALVLAHGGDAGRDVGYADGGGVLLPVLAAVAAGVEDVEAQVLLVDMHVDVLSLWQDGHGGGGRVDAAAGLGHGDPLDAVDAALILETRVGAGAAHLEDDLLEAAPIAGVGVHYIHCPTVTFRVPAVYAVEIAREHGGLLAAGGGPDLHDDVLVG